VKRGSSLAAGALPAIVAALLPKCPACLALYLAMVTGATVSGRAAASIEAALILGAFVPVAFLLWRKHKADCGCGQRGKCSGLGRRFGGSYKIHITDANAPLAPRDTICGHGRISDGRLVG
jgi:hypothetical protein